MLPSTGFTSVRDHQNGSESPLQPFASPLVGKKVVVDPTKQGTETKSSSPYDKKGLIASHPLLPYVLLAINDVAGELPCYIPSLEELVKFGVHVDEECRQAIARLNCAQFSFQPTHAGRHVAITIEEGRSPLGARNTPRRDSEDLSGSRSEQSQSESYIDQTSSMNLSQTIKRAAKQSEPKAYQGQTTPPSLRMKLVVHSANQMLADKDLSEEKGNTIDDANQQKKLADSLMLQYLIYLETERRMLASIHNEAANLRMTVAKKVAQFCKSPMKKLLNSPRNSSALERTEPVALPSSARKLSDLLSERKANPSPNSWTDGIAVLRDQGATLGRSREENDDNIVLAMPPISPRKARLVSQQQSNLSKALSIESLVAASREVDQTAQTLITKRLSDPGAQTEDTQFFKGISLIGAAQALCPSSSFQRLLSVLPSTNQLSATASIPSLSAQPSGNPSTAIPFTQQLLNRHTALSQPSQNLIRGLSFTNEPAIACQVTPRASTSSMKCDEILQPAIEDIKTEL